MLGTCKKTMTSKQASEEDEYDELHQSASLSHNWRDADIEQRFQIDTTTTSTKKS